MRIVGTVVCVWTHVFNPFIKRNHINTMLLKQLALNRIDRMRRTNKHKGFVLLVHFLNKWNHLFKWRIHDDHVVFVEQRIQQEIVLHNGII